MKALTVRQPWASLIAFADKRIENRTWRPWPDVIGRRIAIHAGKKFDEDGRSWVCYGAPGVSLEAQRVASGSHILSSIFCTARVTCFTDQSDSPWFVGPIGWTLKDVLTFDPIPCRGAQGLWEVPADVLARIPERAR